MQVSTVCTWYATYGHSSFGFCIPPVGLCEGGNVIPPDSEAVLYGVLDFCVKPVFSIMLLAGHWNINPARLSLHIRDISEPVAPETEKRHGGHDGEQTAASTGVDTS